MHRGMHRGDLTSKKSQCRVVVGSAIGWFQSRIARDKGWPTMMVARASGDGGRPDWSASSGGDESGGCIGLPI